MREQEWLISDDPQRLLSYLRGRTSDRKLRLFGVACCRLVWAILPDEQSRNAVEVAERFADGMATPEERQAAWAASVVADEEEPSGVVEIAHQRFAKEAAHGCVAYEAAWSARHAASFVTYTAVDFSRRIPQANLIRDIVGNPFRSIQILPATLARNDGTVVKMAQVIYDERAFDRMPILADALEDAGCDNADILRHCREPGEHVRGCWVVDLLLGKS